MEIEKVLLRSHFEKFPLKYSAKWVFNGANELVLVDEILKSEISLDTDISWTTETENIHQESTKTGWIDVYERERVNETFKKLLEKRRGLVIVEFGSSEGYMIEEMKEEYPLNDYIATDLLIDGLLRSAKRNPSVMHIQCDFTNAPFMRESVDIVFSLNVLEHISDDSKTIDECYRVLKPEGYCLFVVPRGEKLYDYFDEMLFHKRRYAKNELSEKCKKAGFVIEDNFHFAWLCYPLFVLKKKINQRIGKRLSQEEKMKRVEADIKTAFASPLAIFFIHIERYLSKLFRPKFGVREFILVKKV